MQVITQPLSIALWLFFFALLARLVVDWIQVFAREWQPKGPLLVVLEAVYTVTDPPLRALRRIIPPLRIGSVAIDLAFIVLIILVRIAISVVDSLG
ncbi:YggT family protein [Actinobacteria bacterium YIM 96077]|uniref:YggT family protein n=1 Tax=Phytoactinopolyspora halophila TaxID=1981511 RepID=A0A329R0A5_9ACTN|nr:YggT family protein [Phytoactinopolyspora halophila]AYY12849.1 YggT family protein [Actinobacteria bacterium YIM 96077]RAW16358.1 YggT family protein [Phytoactinopolyspora halophila]